MRAFIAAACVSTLAACASLPAVEEASIGDLQAAMTEGRASSEALTRAYLDRIARIDQAGPTLRSVIAVNPQAIAEAKARDAERAAGRVRGPLHGVPILIKDNVETRDQPTTAGALALLANETARDAPVTARLREAGAVILGKTNLSEWANYRSTRSISGWSTVGGQTKNPYALDRNPCGSSSGSGAAAAASLAAAAIGTETSGSIVCPASMNGLVGLKPTVGLVPRTHVVPISGSLDTAGPMTRTVREAALILDVLAGSDASDPVTAEADARRTGYAAALERASLSGKRLGVLRWAQGNHPEADALFERAAADLRAAGAEVVDVAAPSPLSDFTGPIGTILQTEFKADIAAYLATAAPGVSARTLDDLIAANQAAADATLALFGQELFEQAAKAQAKDNPSYLATLAEARRKAGPEGIDRMLAAQSLDALIAITAGPAPLTDPVVAARPLPMGAIALMPAIAGYPHLTVPMGDVRGLPVGLSFVGPKWGDGALLALGHAYEQATKRRVAPTYAESVTAREDVTRAFGGAR